MEGEINATLTKLAQRNGKQLKREQQKRTEKRSELTHSGTYATYCINNEPKQEVLTLREVS